MADLVVSSIAVDDAARQLKLIQDEFEKAGSDRDARSDIWGHPVVRSAMSDFVEDWWVKREKLAESIKDLQGKTQKAAETWGETEIHLTEAMKPADP